MSNSVLKIAHFQDSGFFSNCSVRLKEIVNFFNKHGKFPQIINSSEQFRNYKEDENDLKEDITKYFFEEPIVPENFQKGESVSQYQKYKDINFENITPYIQLFFSPSSEIKDTIKDFEKKYSIDYKNICSVYYRGNDKAQETGLADYEQFFSKAEEILQSNPDVKFLIQTDELEFASLFKQKFSNSFFFKELEMVKRDENSSVHHSLPRHKRKEHACCFLAAVIIMSQTRHLITYSGNCGLWTVLYRGSAEGVHQYLKTIERKNNRKIKKNYGWV